jgi:hypothetical protein
MNTRVKFILKWSTVISSSAILTYTLYEANDCIERLRKPLNTNFLFKKCEFIYIDHNYLREPVKDLWNEFFEEEAAIYSYFNNLKRKFSFTKVNLTLILFCKQHVVFNYINITHLLARICAENSPNLEAQH